MKPHGFSFVCSVWIVTSCVSVALADVEQQPEVKKTLEVVATSHLDTQWLWTIQKTITEFLPATTRGNFALFEEYDDYTFSFEGAFRYQLIREYYPEDYKRLKRYIARDRWCVCGSFVDACDVNIPSPESLVRQVLYGNGFFEEEFGKTSCDVFLPDCFGFGYALPSIANHCGLIGFSTQKLSWGCHAGTPFDIGIWEGIGGSRLISAVNPGAYVSSIREDLSEDPEWLARIDSLGKTSGAYFGFKYFGVGDSGGAPDRESVGWLETSIRGKGPISVKSAPADRLFKLLTAEQIDRLPQYHGELTMTRHGTGCYTSQCAMKRWNRQNEQLASAAESAGVLAWLQGNGYVYPTARLRNAWVRFLWHQFHDDLTGTSIPEAYTFSWNDEILSMNQFAGMLTYAVGAVTSSMDTSVPKGMVPIAVFNPLAYERCGLVEATVTFEENPGHTLTVLGPDKKPVPSQVLHLDGHEARVLFAATVPSVGISIYSFGHGAPSASHVTEVKATRSTLENERYVVTISSQGEIASIRDKIAGREYLADPVRLELFENITNQWPEWEIDYATLQKPCDIVTSPAIIRVVESGPVRAAIAIERDAGNSKIVETVSLATESAQQGIRVSTHLDWKDHERLLKVAFPVRARNPKATYDLGWGVIERGNNSETMYEVPAQQWADLTDASGDFGVTVASDCKYGWDKPDDGTLRLTLIHSPNEIEKDFGHHQFAYEIIPHGGDWRKGGAARAASNLNQPLRPFLVCKRHDDPDPEEGRTLSLFTISSPQVHVHAIKKAEKSDELIVRLQEGWGKELSRASLRASGGILSATEVDGMERPVGAAVVRGGKLEFSLRPFQARAFALRTTAAGSPMSRAEKPRRSLPVDLPWNIDVLSPDGNRMDGDIGSTGITIPAELYPSELAVEGVNYILGSGGDESLNAVACKKQKLMVPSMGSGREYRDDQYLYVLAASTEGDVNAAFIVNGEEKKVTVPCFTGFRGQDDSLIVDGQEVGASQMAPEYIRDTPVAWVSTHLHDRSGNLPYVFGYLYKFVFPIQRGPVSVTLPDDPRVVVFSMTRAVNPGQAAVPCFPLHDTSTPVRIEPAGGLHVESITVSLGEGENGTRMYYTLDGRLPDDNSELYDEPFEIKKQSEPVTLTVRQKVRGEWSDSFQRVEYVFRDPLPAQGDVGQITKGLHVSCYEGEWLVLPDYSSLEPLRNDVVDVPSLDPRTRDEQFGLVFDGYYVAPKTGVYRFELTSDDGSRLRIGDSAILDHDGFHGESSRSCDIALSQGVHAFHLEYFNGPGGKALGLRVRVPGEQIRPVEPGDFAISRN